jgi:hypothetical protein
MATKAKSTVVVTPKVPKITKSDIAQAIIAQADDVKLGLLSVAVNSDNLNKLTKDSLVEVVKATNPKFEVLKKTTKGEIIPAILKTPEENLGRLSTLFFTEGNLMKQTKDVLEGIVASINVEETEPTAETSTEPTAETSTEPTDAVITAESVESVESVEETQEA